MLCCSHNTATPLDKLSIIKPLYSEMIMNNDFYQSIKDIVYRVLLDDHGVDQNTFKAFQDIANHMPESHGNDLKHILDSTEKLDGRIYLPWE